LIQSRPRELNLIWCYSEVISPEGFLFLYKWLINRVIFKSWWSTNRAIFKWNDQLIVSFSSEMIQQSCHF
jgi:hypothetical protein